MLGFWHPEALIAVDCGGDLVQRLQAAGLPLEALSALIVTHEHPDHVAGFVLMIQKLWLAGRRDPLPVYGIGPALTQARKCLAAFDTSGWRGFPGVEWKEFPHAPDALVFETEVWRVISTPSAHTVPSIALRVEHRPTGHVCVYSGDTEMCDRVAHLARGADLLIHEATGKHPGHSTAADAAQIAAAAEVGALYLVHLPPKQELDEAAMDAVRDIFPATEKAEELEQVDF